ncbi:MULTISPECIES: hypothetical protein [unclassified Streptomyces]|uniref:hypothetical protein n=1 Tax=unclassified Streptomyces TaxID=2593676 RepID=UPI001F22D614|nr:MULTISPECIES: hypothetical protein [unclassified Streptomyces]MCF0086641.1 hypothetical protein [Streptomyces sp. MH192]MCF0098795.1 hypothetical protein [Streptomyces sp. MH191]
MAIATPAPDPDPAPDLLPLTEASLLLEPTGHPARPRTLKRWLLKYGRPVTSRRGMGDQASWSDVLEVHAAEVDRAGR